MGKELLRDVDQADNPTKARRRLDMSYDWFDQVDVSKLSRLGRIPDAEHGRAGVTLPGIRRRTRSLDAKRIGYRRGR